jgi:hypothetical protein
VQVLVDGSTSLTHAPGRKMATFLWEDSSSGAIIGKNDVLQCFYPFGTYTVSLTVTDSAFETASTSQTIVVAPESRVPGTLPTARDQGICCIRLSRTPMVL